MQVKQIGIHVAAFLIGAGIMGIGISSLEMSPDAQATAPNRMRAMVDSGHYYQAYKHQVLAYEDAERPDVVCYVAPGYSAVGINCLRFPSGK